MINENINIVKNDNNVTISINNDRKIVVSVDEKKISTKKIYTFLDYSIDKKYNLNCSKIIEEKTETDRLYNDIYNLFQKLIEGIESISVNTSEQEEDSNAKN